MDMQSTAQANNPSTRRNYGKASTYLRWIGSILIVISALSFMIQGYQDYLPNYRYWAGIGITLLLFAGGLICSRLVRENKGARVFFALATAFLSVQITQVSAMIYALIHGSNTSQPSQTWLQFNQVEPLSIGINFVASCTLWLMVSYAGFSILARKFSKTLLIASALGNLALVLPLRDPSFVALSGVTLFFILRHFELHWMQHSSMKLLEGITARLLMFLPLLILVGRSLLHPSNELLLISELAVFAFIMVIDVKKYTSSGFVLFISQTWGSMAALFIWPIFLSQLDISLHISLGIIIPLAFILLMLSTLVTTRQYAYRVIASIVALYGCFIALIEGTEYAPLVAIASGILLTVTAIHFREKVPFISGNLCVLAGLLFFVEYAIDFYTSVPWLTSIGVGLLVILLASYLEKREKQFTAKSTYLFNELKSWN